MVLCWILLVSLVVSYSFRVQFPRTFTRQGVQYNVLGRDFRLYTASTQTLPGHNDVIEDNVIVEENMSEEEFAEVLEMALGGDHTEQLSKLMEEAIQSDWDHQQGVDTVAKKNPPLKVNLDLWNYYAKVELMRGNFTSAMKYYEQCTSYDPTDGRAYIGMAKIHWKRNRADLAEATYKQGLYYCPKNAFILQAHAVLCEKQGRLDEAKKLLLTAIRWDQTHSASWCALGSLHKRGGDYSSARYCYGCALQHDPSCYVAHQALGTLEASGGNVSQAKQHFEQAIALSPQSAHAYHAYAVLERNLGDYGHALELYQHLLRIHPAGSRARMGIAEVYELRGERWLARETFAAGERYAQQQGDAGYFQAQAMFLQRQLDAIATRWVRYLQRLRASGDMQEQGQEQAEALQQLLRPSASAPSKYLLPDRLGLLYTLLQSHEQLIQQEAVGAQLAQSMLAMVESTRRAFRLALRANKYHSASYVAYARFEQRLGCLDAARRLLVTGISMFPGSRNLSYFHCALAQLHIARRDVSTARACFQRAVTACRDVSKALPIYIESIQFERHVARDSQAARRLAYKATQLYPQHRKVQVLYQQLCQ
jgi:tetratricopeptide (TPR) repeat protein